MFSFYWEFLRDLARSQDVSGVTATISEIHRTIDVENLLHDGLPGPKPRWRRHIGLGEEAAPRQRKASRQRKRA
jgi:hypothetical protein